MAQSESRFGEGEVSGTGELMESEIFRGGVKLDGNVI